MADLSDVVIQLKAAVQQLSSLGQAFSGRITFGTFTLPAAATVTINNSVVQGNSFVSWIPTNAAAGTLEGSSKKLYLSAVSPGVSFTLKTAAGTNAAGTETFSYVIQTPT